MNIPRSVPGWSLFGSDSAPSASPVPASRQSRNSDAFAGEVRGAMATPDSATTTSVADTAFDGEVRGRMGSAKPNTVATVREAMSQQNQTLSPESEFSLAKATASIQSASPAPGITPGITPVDRLQHRALSALNNLTGGNIDSLGQGLSSLHSGMRGMLLNGGSLKRARGIDLEDRSGGIALDPTQRRTLEQAAISRERRAENAAATAPTSRASNKARSKAQDSAEIGKLAARFESGSEGIAAIGYDRVGGTSYGKFQIASRPGSMDQFLKFLDNNDPAMADRLRAAGPANTGNTKGQMPDEWRQIAAESPDHFEALQEQFIHESHYEPALAAVRRAGYNTREFSPAMKEVLFSTAVQHGPVGASRIFEQAADNVGLNATAQKTQEKQIIAEVYSLRAERFGSSTPQIQAAARTRMEQEKYMALAMN